MRRAAALVAPAVLILSTPVVTWWLVGDVSEPDGYLRMFEPPAFSRGLERAIGMTATAAAVVGFGGFIRALRTATLTRAHRQATTPLVIAGVLLGFGYRVVTSATVGANIGGGLVLMAAPFVMLPLVGVGLTRWVRLRADPRSQDVRP